MNAARLVDQLFRDGQRLMHLLAEKGAAAGQRPDEGNFDRRRGRYRHRENHKAEYESKPHTLQVRYLIVTDRNAIATVERHATLARAGLLIIC